MPRASRTKAMVKTLTTSDPSQKAERTLNLMNVSYQRLPTEASLEMQMEALKAKSARKKGPERNES